MTSMKTMGYGANGPNCAAGMPTIELAYSDIDEQAARLSGYDQQYQQLGPGQFLGKFLTCNYDNDFSIYIEDVNRALFQKFQVPEDQYAICIMMRSDEPTLLNSVSFSENQAIILAPGSDLAVSTSNNMKICVVSIDRVFFETHMLFESVPIFSRLKDDICLVQNNNPFSATHLAENIRLSLKGMANFQNREADGFNAFIHDSKMTLSSSIFSTFSDPTALQFLSRNSKKMERFNLFTAIKETIDEGIADQISITDACDAHTVSRRAAENIFQDYAGTSPHNYIKKVKLNEVRRDLLARRNQGISIGDIAAKWGIWHSGRFASEYHEMFGERPSATKERAARQ